MNTPTMALPFVLILAQHVHLSVRASVASGQTLAHAVAPAQTRPFVEWLDLAPHVVAGRTMTAARLLELYDVEMLAEGTGQPVSDDMINELAAEIHTAEKAAIDGGFVLVKLNRPWIAFAELPEPAQAGRRRQAAFLLERFSFRRHTGQQVVSAG